MAVLIGADPEFFLKEKRTGRNISAHGLVPGTKNKPHKLKRGALQLDGTAVEFNIDPAENAHEFKGNINSVLGQIRKLIPEKYDFNFSPAVKYGPKYFEKIPDDCKELGCNPDHDAYKQGALNPMPNAAGTMRTGAGHIHVGFCQNADVKSPSHMVDCIWIVRNMDALLAPVEHLWDKDTLRRKMYGKPGAFRPKTYGVEYRALSNAWLNYPELYEFIFNVGRCAYHAAEAGHNIQNYLFDEKMGPRTYNKIIAMCLGQPGRVRLELPEKIKGVY